MLLLVSDSSSLNSASVVVNNISYVRRPVVFVHSELLTNVFNSSLAYIAVKRMPDKMLLMNKMIILCVLSRQVQHTDLASVFSG